MDFVKLHDKNTDADLIVRANTISAFLSGEHLGNYEYYGEVSIEGYGKVRLSREAYSKLIDQMHIVDFS